MIAGLYRRYAPELVRYIRKYTEDQAAAEDIVQETFVRGMEHGSQLDMLEESQRRAWLYRTAKISALTVPEGHRQSRPGREKPFRTTT